MAADGAMEEIVRVLPVMVGWKRPYAVVAIAVISLASGSGYRL